jgi:ParB family chromosome partitioning protein
LVQTEGNLTMPTTGQEQKVYYEDIDPKELVIGENVRDNADQGPEFEQLVTSIEEAGQIYVPINAIPGPDGTRVVTAGSRNCRIS